jgi:hypothetical protein
VQWCRLRRSFGLYLPVCWSEALFFFCVLSYSGLLSVGVYFVPRSWCVVVVVELLRVEASLLGHAAA